MASAQSRLFRILLKLLNKKGGIGDIIAAKSRFYDSPEPPSNIKKVCDISKSQVHGCNVFTLKPKGIDSARHVLYLHGGGYMQNFLIFHWWFLAKLVRKTGCTIIAPDYPLAPRHTYQDTFDMVSALYRQLIATVDPAYLTIMGDSAGGGLALALAQKMKTEAIYQPGQIILLSPWLDITLHNPAIREIEAKDPFLNMERLRRSGLSYAGGTDPENYLLSPINGPLDGLGMISVFAGSHEILVADTRRLQSLANSKGIKLNYHEYAGMVHDWFLLNFPESKEATRQIVGLLLRPVYV